MVSVYNEEAVLMKFQETVMTIIGSLPYDVELIYVNDGSQDASESILNTFEAQYESVKVIHFSRNFGHEAAMIAGIDHACGDYIVCMDADLQHPPQSLPSICEAFQEGNQIVLMVRSENRDAGLFKNVTSSAFYGLLNWLGNDKFVKNVSDFFGMDRIVADIFRKEYREKRRYLRGYIQHVGFRKKVIPYVAAPRYAGESKYSIKKLFNVFVIAIVNFSKNLVRAGFLFAVIAFVLALVFAVYSISLYTRIHCWSGIGVMACVVSFFFGLQFVLMGIMGEYIGAILSETNRRPIYIVKETRGYEAGEDTR